VPAQPGLADLLAVLVPVVTVGCGDCPCAPGVVAPSPF